MENIIGDVCGNRHKASAVSNSEPRSKLRKNSRFTGNKLPRAAAKAGMAFNTADAASMDFALDLIRANQQLKNKLALCKRAEKRLQDEVKIARAESASNILFLRDVSHELRTQLNAIIGFSDIIQSELSGPAGNAKYADYARDINQSGMRLLSLMSDMLDVSRMEAGEFTLNEEELDIARCITSSIHRVAQQAQARRVHLLRDIAAGLPLMCGDPARIKQIFTNLMCNAIKFAPAGGNVWIGAAKAVGGGIQVHIFCSITGLAAGDSQKIFGPLGRAATALTLGYDGAGLELLMARLLTKWHDGMLTIDSQPGGVARVMVTFPASRILNEEPVTGRTAA